MPVKNKINKENRQEKELINKGEISISCWNEIAATTSSCSHYHIPLQDLVCVRHPCLTLPIFLFVGMHVLLYLDKEHSPKMSALQWDVFLTLSRCPHLLGWSELGRLGCRATQFYLFSGKLTSGHKNSEEEYRMFVSVKHQAFHSVAVSVY